MSFLSKDVGVDLGTANTLVYMKGKGIIMREPSVVAVDTKTDEVRCVGAEAKAVIGRTPGSIVAVRPLKDGVIADFDITANMLENFLKKACGNSMFSRPRVVICIPSGVTEVERRAVREATLKAGARQVSVIEEPMAAAIGAGLPISEPTGSMIVDIGGGTAEIAVISLGGIVASRSVRMAGDMFDQAIIAFIKRKYNLLIGERTAEQIKIEIGSAYPMDPEMTMEIKGRNLVDGLPKNIVVHSEDVREALLECLVKITSAIKETLERTPPELSADIIDHGILSADIPVYIGISLLGTLLFQLGHHTAPAVAAADRVGAAARKAQVMQRSCVDIGRDALFQQLDILPVSICTLVDVTVFMGCGMQRDLVACCRCIRNERQVFFIVARGHHKKGGLDPGGVQRIQNRRGRFAGAVIEGQADPFLRHRLLLRQ